MSIIIGHSSGLVIHSDPNSTLTIHDSSGRVRLGDGVRFYVGNDAGSISGLNGDDEEEALIRQNTEPCEALSPHQANFKEIKSWIETCEYQHQNLSNHRSADLPPMKTKTGPSFGISSLFNVFGGYGKSPLRLIDVKENCVVETYTPHDYFALSYTWGEDVEQVKLECGTLSQFLTKGSLAKDKILLPKTIRDAITLTSSLGATYLWTDVLCIIQDSDEDKGIQIERMCDIYANAVLTIVAGEGGNANAGLSRVGNYTTDQSMSHDNQPAAQTLDESQRRDWKSLLDKSLKPLKPNGKHWASRAWTYQETILSKRLLLVLQHRIYLSCGHLLFSEGNAAPEGRLLHPRFESLLDRLDRRTGLECYEHAVNIYSKLELTKVDDILRAFDGILSKLRPYLRSGYVFGLPETELESALAWRSGPVLSDWKDKSQISPKGWDESNIGHLIKRRMSSDAGETLNPSWTWAGWVGEVHYHRSVWPIIVGYVQWIAGEDSLSKPLWKRFIGVMKFYRLNSLSLRFGNGVYTGEWSWHSDGRNPIHYTDTKEPKLRFSNVVEPEHERQKLLLIPLPGAENLVFFTTCVSLNLIAVKIIEEQHKQQSCRAAQVPITMKALPIVDYEHFRSGMIDLCEPLIHPADAESSDITATHPDPYLPVRFVLKLSQNQVPDQDRYQKGFQLIVLSRFTGFANTVEDPHRRSRPKDHDSSFDWQPQLDSRLKNIRQPTSSKSPVFQAEESVKEGNDQPFPTYDTRRYEPNKYYPFYSVLLIRWNKGIARRLGSGQIHVDAFEYAKPFEQEVILG